MPRTSRSTVVSTLLLIAMSFVLSFVVAASPAGAAAHDGKWSVLVITEKGNCDRGYRYDVSVADGQVRYSGDGAVIFNGTVAPNGAVKVAIRFGEQGANGVGRLSGNAGAGTWHGAGKGAECSGRWEAERR